MKMKLKPANRFLIVARCKDPHDAGIIELVGQGPCPYGIVIASASDLYAVNDVVYFPTSAVNPVRIQDTKLGLFIHENSILGVVRAADHKVQAEFVCEQDIRAAAVLKAEADLNANGKRIVVQ